MESIICLFLMSTWMFFSANLKDSLRGLTLIILFSLLGRGLLDETLGGGMNGKLLLLIIFFILPVSLRLYSVSLGKVGTKR